QTGTPECWIFFSTAAYGKRNKVPQVGFLLKAISHIDGENSCCIPSTLNGWVYIEPIHGPLDGPLYTWAQYTPTPPRSLNYRRSGVQDWTTRKPTPPRSLNNRRSGVQDWTRREYKGLIPPAATTSHRLC